MKLGLNHPDDPVSDDLLKELGYKVWRDIREASAVRLEHVGCWKQASGKPFDWTDPKRREGFRCAVEERVIGFYRHLWDELKYEMWLPPDSSSESVTSPQLDSPL